MDQCKQNNPTCFDGSQCITCGYDLRALEIDRACPECGTAIELSMRGDRLSLSDPVWVAKLARGQSLLVLGFKISLLAICIGLICLIIAFVNMMVWSYISRAGPGVVVASWIFRVIFTIMGIGLFVGIIITTIGCALITTQDPRESLSESSLSNRNVARKALIAMYCIIVIEFAYSFVLDLFSASNTFIQVYISIMFVLLGISLTVSLVASLRWLAGLALRIPDHDLRKSTLESSRFFYWAILIFIIINIIVPMNRTAAVGGLSVQAILYMSLSCASLIFTFVILFKSNRLYLILREYRNAFRICAAEAATAITSNS